MKRRVGMSKSAARFTLVVSRGLMMLRGTVVR